MQKDATALPQLAEPHPAAAAMRRLLFDLGADEDILRRVHAWTDLRDEPYVYVPPLPAHLVEHLVRLLPAGTTS